jgi:hypothetical protein
MFQLLVPANQVPENIAFGLEEMTMRKFGIALVSGLSIALLSAQAFAQVDTQRPAPGPNSMPSAHRMAALKKCTDGIKFESDRYVNCMTAEGENP